MRALHARLQHSDSPGAKRHLLGALALAALAAGAPRVGAQSPLISFDDAADGSTINTRYLPLGIVLGCLKGPVGRCSDDARAALDPSHRGGPALSAPNVITVTTGSSGYAPAFNESDGYARVHFLSPVSQVSLYALPYQPVSGFSRNVPFMQAFGVDNKLLASAEYPAAGSGGWQPLVITRASRDIRYVVFSSTRDRAGPAVYGLFDNLSYSPMPLPQWQTLAAGNGFSLGIKTDGSLWTWGLNERGQLGLGNTADAAHPHKVGGNDWLAAAAGAQHVAAVQRDGSLWTWGANGAGQLGDGSTRDRLLPAPTGPYGDWTAVAAGTDHTLGVRREFSQFSDNLSLWAWGGNSNGQLGVVTGPGPTAPLAVSLFQIRALAAGDAFSIITQSDAGALQSDAWGDNSVGQLGDGSRVSRSTPGRLTLGGLGLLAAGAGHVAAIRSGTELWTWGMNDSGQLGNGNRVHQAQPARVPGVWQAVAAGGQHTVAIQADGSLWAWGSNVFGQLGDGSTTDRAVPAHIGTDQDWVAVAAGRSHTLAAKSDGSLWAWGRNEHGQLGDRSSTQQTTPQRSGLLRVDALAGTHGRMRPTGQQAADYLARLNFRVTAERGYTANVSGCGGQLQGLVYTTAPIMADCQVKAWFAGPRANLQVATFSLPDHVKVGGQIKVRTTVINSGTLAAAASSTCASYAPASSRLPRPQKLACRPVPALAAGASFTERYVAQVPPRVPAGSYTLTARVDADGVVDENIETDNTAQATLEIVP